MVMGLLYFTLRADASPISAQDGAFHAAERVERIELSSSDWKSEALPLDDTRIKLIIESHGLSESLGLSVLPIILPEFLSVLLSPK